VLKNVLEWTVGDASTYGKPVAWINVSSIASPTGGADAHESLRKVLGYVGAEIVESACVRVPLSRSMLDADGLLTDAAARRQIAEAIRRLAEQAAQPVYRPDPVRRDIQINEGTIRLGQLLKLADVIGSGAEVKRFLAERPVRVNGEPEARRGRQLHPGDLVEVGDVALRLVSMPVT